MPQGTAWHTNTTTNTNADVDANARGREVDGSFVETTEGSPRQTLTGELVRLQEFAPFAAINQRCHLAELLVAHRTKRTHIHTHTWCGQLRATTPNTTTTRTKNNTHTIKAKSSRYLRCAVLPHAGKVAGQDLARAVQQLHQCSHAPHLCNLHQLTKVGVQLVHALRNNCPFIQPSPGTAHMHISQHCTRGGFDRPTRRNEKKVPHIAVAIATAPAWDTRHHTRPL